MKKFVLGSLLCFSVLFLSAQQSSGGLHKFKTYDGKDYLVFGIGPNYLFGDAGGSNMNLKLMFNDWDILYTRPSIMWGYKHEYNEFIANKLVFMYSLFSGNDDDSRHNRQFQFYANAIEASFQTEIYFYKGRYKRQDFDLYGYFGIAGLYYQTNWKFVNPVTGKLVTDAKGNPTPGRGIGTDSPTDFVPVGYTFNDQKQMFEYSAPTLALPFGLGARFPLNNKVYIGGEFGWRYPIGKNADFIDGFYTKWSRMNDAYCNFNFVITYKVAGGDNCYSKYGRTQIGRR